jgi:hypothetical protein
MTYPEYWRSMVANNKERIEKALGIAARPQTEEEANRIYHAWLAWLEEHGGTN